jgi:MFS family permease
MAVILIVAAPINALRVLSDAAFTSAVPGLVGREHLGRANGYMEATLSVPFIVGPAIAGVLVATIGAATTLAIDAASFAVSAASLTLVRRTLRAERPAEMPRIVTDIKEGIRFVWNHEVLRSLIAYFAVATAATAALLPALAYYLTVDRPHGAELFGLVGSTWSGGYLVGSLLAGRLGGKLVGARMLACGAVIGAMLVVISASGTPAVYLGASFFVGAALAVQLVSYLTLRASITPDELLGRVGSTARTVTLGLQPLGLLAGAALLDAADGGVTLLTMGLVAIGASLLFGLSRTVRHAGH